MNENKALSIVPTISFFFFLKTTANNPIMAWPFTNVNDHLKPHNTANDSTIMALPFTNVNDNLKPHNTANDNTIMTQTLTVKSFLPVL